MKTILTILALLTLQSCGTLAGNLALVKYVGTEDQGVAQSKPVSYKAPRVLDRAPGNNKNITLVKLDKAVCADDASKVQAPLEEQQEYYLKCMEGRGYVVRVVSQEEYERRMAAQ